jgi:hypothetical protein
MLALFLSACNKPADTTSSTTGTTGSVASTPTDTPKAEPTGEPLDLAAYNTAIQEAQKEMAASQQEMQQLQTEAQSGQGDKAALTARLGEALKKAGAAASSSAEKLAAINPPADLKTVHQDLVDGNRNLGTTMVKAGESLGGSGGDAAMQGMQAEAQKMAENMMKHLGEAGYEIGPDGMIKKKG